MKPIVSKTSLGQIQVVLTDDGNGELSAEVALALKKDFEGRLSNVNLDSAHSIAISNYCTHTWKYKKIDGHHHELISVHFQPSCMPIVICAYEN